MNFSRKNESNIASGNITFFAIDDDNAGAFLYIYELHVLMPVKWDALEIKRNSTWICIVWNVVIEVAGLLVYSLIFVDVYHSDLQIIKYDRIVSYFDKIEQVKHVYIALYCHYVETK